MSHSKEAHLFFLMMDCLNSIQRQKDRIREDKIGVDKQKNGSTSAIYADIHYLLVEIAGFKKALDKFLELKSGDIKLKIIHDRYREKIKLLCDIRHHLEHITDGRFDGIIDRTGESLKDPLTLGVLNGNEYNFGGQSFNLVSTYALMEDVGNELMKWNEELF